MNNLENNFVPKQIAIDMRSIGFDEPCFGFYIGDIIRLTLYTDCGWKNSTIPYSTQEELLTTPLYQQCFRWFREKYNIVHTVYSNASGYMWELHYNTERGGTHICDSAESGDCEMSGMFTTYEKAEIKCLKKLIEIVKNK
jgi:hypothetical protein